jgi:hypothetical protein
MCTALERHLQDGARPQVPEAGAILWGCFADLCGGPEPITLPEILAWAELHKMPFAPPHVRVIRDLDAVWRRCASAKPPAPPITPEGFDAVFG